jgi:hypothetical protein
MVICRGATRLASQVIDYCAQAVSRGGARFALQVHDRGAQAGSRGAASAAGIWSWRLGLGRDSRARVIHVPEAVNWLQAWFTRKSRAIYAR